MDGAPYMLFVFRSPGVAVLLGVKPLSLSSAPYSLSLSLPFFLSESLPDLSQSLPLGISRVGYAALRVEGAIEGE